MADPILLSVAMALIAGRAASATAAADRFERLARTKPEVAAAMDAADEAALVAALERAAERDPGFGERLRRLRARAGAELRADSGGTVNHISGTVSGNVVQARDIHGGLTFGSL